MNKIALEVARLLVSVQSTKLVLAESCTGGMAATLLTQVPGISQFFCGSAVTYREDTKSNWLHVSKQTLQCYTAESKPTTESMAIGVLQQTPEATLSAAITGHLGPDAASAVDGIVYTSVATQTGNEVRIENSTQQRLRSTTRTGRQQGSGRVLTATDTRPTDPIGLTNSRPNCKKRERLCDRVASSTRTDAWLPRQLLQL
jgi:nicotinamide-nucleotide amidase